MEIIIAGIGLEMGIISAEIFSILVFMAIFTTLTVPLFLTWTTKWLKNRGELIHQESRKGFLILGANPLGIHLAKHLKEENDVTVVDSNREMVDLAKEEGLNAVFGNILKEETMEQAKAIDKGTFIALTGNSEINLLAAQLANDSFYIPKKIVLMDPKESGAGVDLLDRIDASSMFASKTKLDPWTYKISTNSAKEQEILVEEEISTRQWVKELKNKTGISSLS